MRIRALAQEEQKYTFPQSMQIEGQTGNIGYLQGDFGEQGNAFSATWKDCWKKWKTEEFQAELDEMIQELCLEEHGPLAGRKKMGEFVKQFSERVFPGSSDIQYGFRVDTEKHAFLFRCSPAKGDSDFYCFCYISKWLDGHIKKAAKGIQFIDSHYKEKFRIPDGGKILIMTAWGEKREEPCRYIDEYHTEIGRRIFHICEFAECMERNGSTYEPKQEDPQKTAKKKVPER
ncbi:MAG: hypothetical protein HFH25_04040 [Lachnospiraceae bacterium]|nr:hypothetical protein [Lachnospiraceae bacterium]